MDWGSLGQKIAGLGAEVLGEAIPGGGMAVDIVSQVLGVEKNPDKIAQAIDADPEAAVKLKRIEADRETELKRIAANRQTDHEKELTKRQGNVSDTIQVGYKEGVLWRRAVGWAFVFCSCMVVIRVTVLPVILSAMGEPDILQDAPLNVQLIKWVFSCFLAVLGVSSWHEGLMGRVMAGESEGGIAKAVKALRGK